MEMKMMKPIKCSRIICPSSRRSGDSIIIWKTCIFIPSLKMILSLYYKVWRNDIAISCNTFNCSNPFICLLCRSPSRSIRKCSNDFFVFLLSNSKAGFIKIIDVLWRCISKQFLKNLKPMLYYSNISSVESCFLDFRRLVRVIQVEAA
jgi:hypothetical protein